MAKNSQMLSWRSHMINFQTAGKVSEVPVTSSTPTVYVPPDTLPWFQFNSIQKKKKFSHRKLAISFQTCDPVSKAMHSGKTGIQILC